MTYKAEITIDQLLRMTSGLALDESGSPLSPAASMPLKAWASWWPMSLPVSAARSGHLLKLERLLARLTRLAPEAVETAGFRWFIAQVVGGRGSPTRVGGYAVWRVSLCTLQHPMPPIVSSELAHANMGSSWRVGDDGVESRGCHASFGPTRSPRRPYCWSTGAGFDATGSPVGSADMLPRVCAAMETILAFT